MKALFKKLNLLRKGEHIEGTVKLKKHTERIISSRGFVVQSLLVTSFGYVMYNYEEILPAIHLLELKLFIDRLLGKPICDPIETYELPSSVFNNI